MEVDNSSSVHAYNRKKYILILIKGRTDGLEGTAITAEAEYFINFKKFGLSLNYNRSKSFLFVNGVKNYQFKTKNSEIYVYSLCLGNISKYFIVDNKKKLDSMGICIIVLMLMID